VAWYDDAGTITAKAKTGYPKANIGHLLVKLALAAWTAWPRKGAERVVDIKVPG